MKIFPLLFCLVLIFASSVFAQDNQTADCPTMDVSGGGIPEKGQPQIFTVNIVDSKNREFEYIWTISRGKIISGQGTPTITVESEECITATVEIKGLPEVCSRTESEGGSCGLRPPKPRLFDEYGPLPNGDLKARTQNLFIDIANNSGAQGYIISYGTWDPLESTCRHASLSIL